MQITSIDLAIVAFIVIVIFAYLLRKEASINRVTRLAQQRADDEEVKKAEQDAADRRRMHYEADAYNEAASMEPFCGAAQAEEDRQARSRQAIRRAQIAARDAARKP